MKIFYSDTHLLHNPPFEIYDGGEKFPHLEIPERAERILSALKTTSWAEITPPEDFGLAPILAVHNADYIDFLRKAYDEWLLTDIDAGTIKPSCSRPPSRPKTDTATCPNPSSAKLAIT
jgi:acetoin utilization deacetylase AcuC-like enzyme